jgi:excisionase family DNA binding protein
VRFLTVKDAAEQLGYSERRIRELLKIGRLPGRKEGRKWLIPQAEVNKLLGVSQEADQGRQERHQSTLLSLLAALQLDLARFAKALPNVWQPPMTLGASMGVITVVEERDTWEWQLSCEQSPGYGLLVQHLESGVPEGEEMLRTWRRSGGRYSQLLSQAVDCYRVKVFSTKAANEAGVRVNEHHFFRSMLETLDLPSQPPSLEGYRVAGGEPWSVTYGSAQQASVLVDSLPSRGEAERWRDRHVDMRKEFRASPEYRTLATLRLDLRKGAAKLCTLAESLDLSEHLPGECDVCRDWRRGDA